MKLMGIALCVVFVFVGCYSTMPISKDELAPDERDVFFRLHDDSYVESDAGNHLRIEGGYKIKGELVKGDFHKEFEGVVRDNQITEIEVREVNTGLTVFAVVLAVSVPVYMVVSFYTGTWE